MRGCLRGPPLHIYKYIPFGCPAPLLLPHCDLCLLLSSAGDSLDLELHLSPATLRATCLRGNGCLLSLRRPTFGAIKTRGCSPVMAVVFLAQVRLTLTLGTTSEFFSSPILIGDFLFLLIPFYWIFLPSLDPNCIISYPILSPFCLASSLFVRVFLA